MLTQYEKKRMALEKIISLCSKSPKTSREIAALLSMNYDTVRSSYIYFLVKKNKLKRIKNQYLKV
tara:strand:+ start:72 stop:266 length:195 start_codon:yes stop_codon:yes gene_type:complete